MSKRRALFQKTKEVEKIYSQINCLVRDFKQINYGDHYESSDTWEAANLLELLPIYTLVKSIEALSDQISKWNLAIKLTNEVSKMIIIAEDCAGPMVDGTKGGFCFTAACDVMYLWVHICQAEIELEQKVDEDILSKITLDFEKSFGRYADLSFIKSNPGAFPPLRNDVEEIEQEV